MGNNYWKMRVAISIFGSFLFWNNLHKGRMREMRMMIMWWWLMMTVDDDSDDNNAPERNGKGTAAGMVAAAPMAWRRSFSSSKLKIHEFSRNKHTYTTLWKSYSSFENQFLSRSSRPVTADPLLPRRCGKDSRGWQLKKRCWYLLITVLLCFSLLLPLSFFSLRSSLCLSSLYFFSK